MSLDEFDHDLRYPQVVTSLECHFLGGLDGEILQRNPARIHGSEKTVDPEGWFLSQAQ